MEARSSSLRRNFSSSFNCKMYMPRKNKPFYHSLRYLQFTHYYPVADNNTIFRKCRTIIIRGLIIMILLLQSFLHAYFFAKNNAQTDTAEDLAVFVSVVNYIYICNRFDYLAEYLSKLYFSISDTTKYGEPSNWDKVIKRNKLFTLFVLLYGIIAILFYCMLKIFFETGKFYVYNLFKYYKH
ncbi:unnamed protein product [Ceutorhynchus assimilis]|uniref:Uncharacterized protein n=1 Tax=Ceutorhynchus assimilis TaxID=467358 RepID=A0A9N9MJQ4_9CUCU|nr:unnamed protein product [Ceutorhynchus assimilis]